MVGEITRLDEGKGSWQTIRYYWRSLRFDGGRLRPLQSVKAGRRMACVKAWFEQLARRYLPFSCINQVHERVKSFETVFYFRLTPTRDEHTLSRAVPVVPSPSP